MAEFSMGHPDIVSRAVVLAAGNGDRFHSGTPHSKLLTPVRGTPLLIRTLESAFCAGIRTAHIVLGYDAQSVRTLAQRDAPAGLTLHFHLNKDWRQENGLSVLAARSGVDHQPFALMMGDHIFEPSVLRLLLEEPAEPNEALLCIDRGEWDAETAREATKVRLDGVRVRAIGKTIDPYDALDTGLFVCGPSIFGALEESCAAGDSTLSGGVRRLAGRGLVRGVDIGDARWCDIDTLDDLTAAEQLVGHRSAT